MKLYEVPRNTWITVDFPEYKERLLFHRIDGAYSLCTDKDGYIYHLAAWTDVEVDNDSTG